MRAEIKIFLSNDPEIRKDELTHERLKQILEYNPETGTFIWKEKISQKVVIGHRAGSQCRNTYASRTEYRYIRLFKKTHTEHRLAFFYMTGEWPNSDVDHKNRNGFDNRWDNLRIATRAQNNANMRKSLSNTSGFKGVHRDNRNGKWIAQISINNKTIHIGSFASIQEAANAYQLRAATERGEFASHT